MVILTHLVPARATQGTIVLQMHPSGANLDHWDVAHVMMDYSVTNVYHR